MPCNWRAARCSVASACLLWMSGCDNLVRSTPRTPQEPADFSTVRIPGVSLRDAGVVATDVFKEHFRVDPAASTSTSLVSRPVESDERADQETAGVREVLSGASNRRRQIARLQLVERGADVLVRCHIQVQRLDVSERSAFVPQRGGDDRPANQPVERGTGPRDVSEADWSNVGRNRQLERNILDQVADRLAPVTTGNPAGAATRPQ